MSEAHETIQLDSTKLAALTEEPQQQLFVISFLASLEHRIDLFDADDASAHQLPIQRELLRIVQLSAPSPTRLIRTICGRCFAGIFRKGDRKLLFDTINELLVLVNSGKDKDLRVKHAAAHCLGEVFDAAGDSAVSVATFAASSLMKLFKNSQNHCGLRSTIMKSLGKIFKMVGNMSDESVARDAWKQARNAAIDKSSVVQAAGLQCMEELVKYTPYFTTLADYEKLQIAVHKAFDSPSSVVRKSAASCLAGSLVLAYSTEPAELINKHVKKATKKTKRNSMQLADEDAVVERPSSPAPGKKQPVKMVLSLEDILKQLSTHYVKPATPARCRAGLAQTYIEVVKRLGSTIVEANYGIIANHLLVDLSSATGITINRFRLLTTRRYVRIILEDVIGKKLLGETGQQHAIRWLVNDVIKNYPQVIKERPEPSKHALAGALHAVASLVKILGSATMAIQDLIRDGILQVLQHPSYTVQITASWCLRALVLSVPAQLLQILTICMNNVNRELSQLTTRRPATSDSFRKCTGYANGLAAAISTAPVQPLYASVDVTSRILSLATSLLKSSGNYDLRISSTQIQVAWILIGGLMSLGPNFVKIHLSQLLLLWKNALPKPLAKDSSKERSMLELSFLAHVRECALGSILSFLEFNHRLLTADVSKRISSMLQNSTLFLNSLPAKKTTDDPSELLSPALQLLDFDLMVRRRVLQCYVKLVKLSEAEGLQANLLTVAISFFADPEKYTPSSLSTAIAHSAGNFESLWDIGDNYAYGVCGFVRGFDIEAYAFEGRDSNKAIKHWMTRESPEARIEETLYTPILGSIEHDSVSLYLPEMQNDHASLAPPATAVVDSAVDLFTVLLPMQQPKVQESILEQLATFLASNTLQRDPGRKAAMTVNIAVALLGALKCAVGNVIPSANLTTPSVLKIMSELLQGFVILPDPFVRNVAYEALGRLCSVAGNNFTGSVINWLVETVVNNRDPNARAGSAVALGCIHSHVGGMAAGYHLKSIIQILISLSNDPHPTVHFWALDGLARTIDSAGLTFSAYVTSTLGMLSQLYVAETHNPDVGSLVSSNLELELPTVSILVRCIDSLIGVLGPDLMDATKARDLILTMIRQFLKEPDYVPHVEALRCLEHLTMFAGQFIDTPRYVKRLQLELGSEHEELRDVAIDGLYQMMKPDAERVFSMADPGLEDALWLTLDEHPSHEGVRNIIRNWMTQTALDDLARWVERCQNVMTKTIERKSGIVQQQSEQQAKSAAAADLGDEEVAGMAGGEKEATNTGQEHLRWQVRTFAMQILGELLSLGAIELSKDTETPLEEKFVQKIGDIVKMAFTASTANVVDLRLAGLRIVDLVLKMFGHTPDPDFHDAPLLEQYQAQIGSALTPAFAADSSPELATVAVNVCAGFIATGIVKDVDRMGRILKLLTNALENFSVDMENIVIGDLKGLSSNAQVMVKMAVLKAWAELQVASKEQTYLVDVVKPHITTLAPMWLSSLREFARLRFEPDISTNSSGGTSIGGSIDNIYSALNRDTLLRFYQDSWLKMVDAIASLIELDSQFVFDALDGKSASDTTANGSRSRDDINYRDEPVAFFFVLFGIAFEALVGGRPGTGVALATKEQNLEILLALKKILHPSVCGHAIYQGVIFSETMDLLDRLVLTEGLAVQLAIVDIARALCIEHPAARGKNTNAGNDGDNGLSEEIDQLFELTRLIVLVIAGLLPNLVDSKKPVRQQLSEEAVNLVRTSLDALVDAAEVFPAVIRMDLYASILHIFITIFGTGVCQSEVVPRSLPIFKRFIQIITKTGNKNDAEQVMMMVRSCLSSIMRVLDHAKLRGEAAIPCVRNTLMAAALLVTSGVSILPPNESQLPALCDHLLDSLLDSQTVTISIQCIRLLLSTSPKSATDQEIVRYLLPKLVRFVATGTIPGQQQNHSSGDEDTRHEDIRNAVSVLLTTSFIQTLFGEQIKVALCLFVPMLLECARSAQGAKTPSLVAQRLLELAATEREGFKAVVANLAQEQRTFLEEVLKKNVAAQGMAAHRSSVGNQPSIALKMNFGA